MIQLPESPAEDGFDPDATYTHPKLRQAPHVIPLSQKENTSGTVVAVMADADTGLRQRPKTHSAVDPEQARIQGALFDNAHLRGTLTDLHEQGDAAERDLAAARGEEVADMSGKARSFLSEQEHRRLASLTNNRQKLDFATAFSAYSGEFMERVGALRESKIREYNREVTERQNGIFLDAALKPSALFDDQAQTRLRDMCLMNVENLHADLPEAERREKIDAFAGEYYRAILDKRLEKDPAAARSMLDAPAVARVLGDEYRSGFAARADAAIRDDAMTDFAKDIVVAGLEDGEVRKRVAAAYSDPEERKTAKDRIEHYRYNRDRDAVADRAGAVGNAWNAVKANAVRRGAIPDAVRRNDGDLYAFLDKQIRRTQENGGRVPEPDYDFLVKQLDRFEPRATAGALRKPDRFYKTVDRLGGPDSAATQAYFRHFFGQATEGDGAWFGDLKIARDEAERRLGRSLSGEEANRFLAGFDDERRMRVAGAPGGRLSAREAKMVASECVEAFLGEKMKLASE